MVKGKRAQRRGFPLLELLVVIGIVALLIAIVVPALSSVRESGRRVICGSNLRQLGLAMALYLNDNRGSFPYLAAGDPDNVSSMDWVVWRQSEINAPAPAVNLASGGIGPYLKLTPAKTNILICPSDPNPNQRGAEYGFPFSYTCNWHFGPLATGTLPKASNAEQLTSRLVDVRLPSEKVWMLEEDDRTVDDGSSAIWFPQGLWFVTNLLSNRHDRVYRRLSDLPRGEFIPNSQGRGNVLLADGHVDFLPRSFVHTREHALGDDLKLPSGGDYIDPPMR